MTITNEDIQHLADLSNITISPKEQGSLKKDLETILAYIDQLDELNTDGVEPTYQVTGLENISRPDELAETPIDRTNLLDLTNSVENYQIKVPKVL